MGITSHNYRLLEENSLGSLSLDPLLVKLQAAELREGASNSEFRNALEVGGHSLRNPPPEF